MDAFTRASKLVRKRKKPTDLHNHRVHPTCTLSVMDTSLGFTCKVCDVPDKGKRYRCRHGCDFDVHLECTRLKDTVVSGHHPGHGLTLHPREVMKLQKRYCKACRKEVTGVFYNCGNCHRCDLHPTCVKKQLPVIPCCIM